MHTARVPLSFLLCLLVLPTLALAQERVTNGDFEAVTMAPWTVNRWNGDCAAEVDPSRARHGGHSLRFEAVGGCKIGVSQPLGALAPGWYRLSGAARAVRLSEGQWRRTCMLSVEQGDNGLFEANLPVGTYDWRPFSWDFEVKTGAPSTLYTYLFNTGRVWLDNLSVQPLAQPSAVAGKLVIGPDDGSLAAALTAGRGWRCSFCGAAKFDETQACPVCGYHSVPARAAGPAFYREVGGNLVANGDFDAPGTGSNCPFAGWHGRQMLGGEYQFTLVPGRRGQAARITGTKAGRGDIHNLTGFRVKAGAMLRVRFWCRTERLDGGAFAQLEGEPNDDGWHRINVSASAEWKLYEATVKVPPGAQGQQEPAILLWFYNFGTGSLLIDDISATVVEPDPIARARAGLEALQRYATGPLAASDPAVRAACAPVTERIQAAMAKPDPAVLPALRQATFSALGRAFGGDGSFAVGVADSLAQVFIDEPYAGEFAPELSLALARGETEAAQAVVLACDQVLLGVTVAAEGDLSGPGGARLPAEQISLRRVGYVDTSVGGRPYVSPKLGWWPDPLLPNAAFDVRPGESQPVWVSVAAGEQTAPGRYTGHLRITANGKAVRLPLAVEVFDFALPAKGHYPALSFGCSPEAVARYYGADPGQAAAERFALVAARHRLVPGSLLNGWAWDKPTAPRVDGVSDYRALDRWIDLLKPYVTRFPLVQVPRYSKFGGGAYDDGFRRRFAECISDYAAHLRAKGLFPAAVMYNIDEASDSLKEWDVCRDLYRLTKQAAPDLPVVQCLNEYRGVQALAGSADIWDLYYGQYEQAGGPARQKAGDRVMLAVCIWPSERPNVFIEYPLLDARILPWIGRAVGADGFEYWEMIAWGDNRASFDWESAGRGTRTAWRLAAPHGDGLLIYPGADGQPRESLRLAALRDGLDDYEYLHLLAQRTDPAAKALLDEATRRLVTGVTDYDHDPRRLLDLRLRIGRLLSAR